MVFTTLGGEGAVSALIVVGIRPVALSIIGANSCVISWSGFGGLAVSIRRSELPVDDDPLAAAPAATIRVSNGGIQKTTLETNTCGDISITNACYLCNTLRKRGGVGPFRAVPLLRVQKSSAIVITRRRGASRSRPVRWFAEVPRADAGVSEGAKRLTGFQGIKGTNLRVSRTRRIRNLPYRATLEV